MALLNFRDDLTPLIDICQLKSSPRHEGKQRLSYVSGPNRANHPGMADAWELIMGI